MKLTEIEDRADKLIKLGEAVLETTANNRLNYVDSDKLAEFRSASLSFLKRVFGQDSPYYKDFDQGVTDISDYYTEKGIGILKAAKNEINGGWLFTTKGLISAELFSDFLEMAEHLLEENYKDPAAVLVGSTLEEHLRQLCEKNQISIYRMKNGKEIPHKADYLNSQLKKAEVYSKLDQKQVTAWLDLRNKAAHGKYDEYSEEQVKLMLNGVSNFISRITL